MNATIPRTPRRLWSILHQILIPAAIGMSTITLTSQFLEWERAYSVEWKENQTALVANIMAMEQLPANLEAFSLMRDARGSVSSETLQSVSAELAFENNFLKAHEQVCEGRSNAAASVITDMILLPTRMNGLRAVFLLVAILILLFVAMCQIYFLRKANVRIAELEQALANRESQG
jgi:hypothetical protein